MQFWLSVEASDWGEGMRGKHGLGRNNKLGCAGAQSRPRQLDCKAKLSQV